jgi:hypothetical protein
MFPAIEIEWEDWQALHPDTRVVSSRTGRGRDYTRYPYGSYEVEDNELTLIPPRTARWPETFEGAGTGDFVR